MSERDMWKKDLKTLEGDLNKLEQEEKEPKTYFSIKFFIIISCVLGMVVKPITLFWTIPMSIYVFYKVTKKKKIGMLMRILSWVLISPIVGGMLMGYKEEEVDAKYKNSNKEFNKNDFSNIKIKEDVTINEKSLVKVEQFTHLSHDKLFSFGEIWVAFSNIYLENAGSFPDLDIKKLRTLEFKEYYYNLIEMQKGILPKPKKHLNIAEGDLDFYYPCSEIFSVMEGKQKGDVVKIRGGDIFKIIEIINPQ